jgi:hypothetical protein
MDQVLDVALHPPVPRKPRVTVDKKADKKPSKSKAAKETVVKTAE